MRTRIVELTELEVVNLKYVIKEQQVELIELANSYKDKDVAEILQVHSELEDTYNKLDRLFR